MRTAKTFVTAIAVAYEVLCSFADAVGLRERGWDYVTFTALAAALGAGKVLNLPEEKLKHCLSLAAVCNSALGQTRLGELSMWKGLASANACRNGVFASMLAADGVTGPGLCFEGKNGLISQVTGPLELSGLGKQPLRAGIVYLKSWPVFLQRAGVGAGGFSTQKNRSAQGDQVGHRGILQAAARQGSHRSGEMDAQVSRNG